MEQNQLGSSSSTLFRNYDENKGWSSERVPHASSNQGSVSRKHTMSAAWTPFYSGRTLPFKWEDAERWICSPISGYDGTSSLPHSQQYLRRPKSKSGPITPPGIDGASARNFVENSPFSTGVLMPDGVGVHFTGVGVAGVNGWSASMPNWFDLVSESSLPGSRDEKVGETQETDTRVTRVVPRRDTATQMSSDDSTPNSSPKPRTLTSPPATELQTHHPLKLEIREVQVDNRATVMNIPCSITNQGSSLEINCFNQNGNHELVPTSPWTLSEATSDLSRLQREEAKIAAWENLQKAKAEAAIRKLEMKLEKKRSSSMDKILNKLRTAQDKAQQMRSEHRLAKNCNGIHFFSKHPMLSSMTRCFTCDSPQ